MRKLLVLALSAFLALGVAACGDDEDEGGSGGGGGGSSAGEVSGNIRIDGSSTVQPFAEAAAELFQEENPDVKITVGGAGTGDGFEKFCRGETDISDASRAIEAEEQALCKKGKIKPVEVRVASDGVTVVSSKDLEIDCITTGQLKKIFEPKSKLKNLSEAGGGLPDAELSLFTPGAESGTFDFFTEQVNGEEGVQRTEGIQTSADDNVIITGVSGEQGGLGYVGYSFYEQSADELNAVPVDGGKGCIEPSAETITDGSYAPLSRPLFMYPSEKSLQKPQVKAFLDFAVENHQEISEAAQIVPMSEEQAQESATAIGG